MTADLLLAIDVGTQSVRALAFDRDGSCTAGARVPFEPPFGSPQPGWAEKDAESYWQGLAEACRALWQPGGGRAGAHRRPGPHHAARHRRLRARGRHAAQAGDRLAGPAPQQRAAAARGARGPPVRPGRGERADPPAAAPGRVQLAGPARARALAECERYALLSGWLTHRLVGEWVDSAACQVGYLPFDYKRQQWARPGEWHWKALAIRSTQLPRLVPPARRLGSLTAAAAAALGLPAGCP
jgi:sugar (pentulose or hexulose) kinase